MDKNEFYEIYYNSWERDELEAYLTEKCHPQTFESGELIAICIVFTNVDSEDEKEPYWEYELTFAVPVDWLVSFMNKNWKTWGKIEINWNKEKVKAWLRDDVDGSRNAGLPSDITWNSPDLALILSDAVRERKVALWQIDKWQ